jgi:hypothetical protein
MSVREAVTRKEGGDSSAQLEKSVQHYSSRLEKYGDHAHRRETMARIHGNIPDLVQIAERRLNKLKPACDIGYDRHLKYATKIVYTLVAATAAQQLDPIPQKICLICAILRGHARQYVEHLEPFEATAKENWVISVFFFCHLCLLKCPEKLELQPLPERSRKFVTFDCPASDLEQVCRHMKEWAHLAPKKPSFTALEKKQRGQSRGGKGKRRS